MNLHHPFIHCYKLILFLGGCPLSSKENVETLLEFLGLVIGKAIFEGIVPCHVLSKHEGRKVQLETFPRIVELKHMGC